MAKGKRVTGILLRGSLRDAPIVIRYLALSMNTLDGPIDAK
jgi:hypothetical protein